VCERGGEWRGVRVFVWLKSKSKKRGGVRMPCLFISRLEPEG